MLKELIDDTIGSRCIKIIKDGLEVVAKEKSCSGRKDGISLFLDSSVGCNLGCSYCWLTRNKTTFIDVKDNAWLELLDAVVARIKCVDWTTDRNVFVKFMGQGDPLSNPLQTLDRINLLEDRFCENDIVLGGISYSSIFPSTAELDHISKLFQRDTTIFPRVYVSVGSFIKENRAKVFPKCRELEQALSFCDGEDVDLRLHWTPLNIIKNIDDEINIGLDIITKYNIKHMRIIPYNPMSENDVLRQYDDINSLVEIINTKCSCDVLNSSGQSIDAACGMFSSKRK